MHKYRTINQTKVFSTRSVYVVDYRIETTERMDFQVRFSHKN